MTAIEERRTRRREQRALERQFEAAVRDCCLAFFDTCAPYTDIAGDDMGMKDCFALSVIQMMTVELVRVLTKRAARKHTSEIVKEMIEDLAPYWTNA